MQSRRFVPKPVFQAIALLLLLALVLLLLYWDASDTGLYHQMRLVFTGGWEWLAMPATFTIMFVGWLVIVLPVRLFTDMPTMKEELGVGEGGASSLLAGMSQMYKTASAENEEMYRAREYTPELTRRARQIGVWFLILGAFLTLVGLWTLLLTLKTGRLFKAQVLVLVLVKPVVAVHNLAVVGHYNYCYHCHIHHYCYHNYFGSVVVHHSYFGLVGHHIRCYC